MDTTKGAFREILTELIKERNLTLTDVSRESGVPLTTVWDWCNKERSCPMMGNNLLKIARYFNVNLMYLLFGIGEKESLFLPFSDEKSPTSM